ncbi:MAG: ABC-F family ATP-binding cassette domain-containing protein, partial [Aeoliella sp.]
LTNLAERREHDRRVNAATLVKRKQLETFINKNRANANTASQARNKAKQLDRLQLVEIAGDESSVAFSFPNIQPRTGPAMRTEGLAIGYSDLRVADDIHVEIEHGSRVGLVGDNGQGKTTFLRTLCGSIEPLEGQLKWGFGCQVGVYAQHVYTSLDERKTVMEYLEYQAAADVTTQQIKGIAGSFLFSGQMVEKPIKVLSGGERARLVLAGLLLEQHNVLLLDEPGNHLDVETVEALADALEKYQGTVVFTSHDRHFMHRVATDVIEVRDGGVVSYPASYDDYVYRVQQEIDAGLRAEAAAHARPNASTSDRKAQARAGRDAQKRLKAVERKIARLDSERKDAEGELLSVTDQEQAEQLHDRVSNIGTEIESLEHEWLELYETVEEAM